MQKFIISFDLKYDFLIIYGQFKKTSYFEALKPEQWRLFM